MDRVENTLFFFRQWRALLDKGNDLETARAHLNEKVSGLLPIDPVWNQPASGLDSSASFSHWAAKRLAESEHPAPILAALAPAFERLYMARHRFQTLLTETLRYPSLILLMGLLVVGILYTRVLPIFDQLYASIEPPAGYQLAHTVNPIAIGLFLVLLVGSLTLEWQIRRCMATGRFLPAWIVRLPVLGRVFGLFQEGLMLNYLAVAMAQEKDLGQATDHLQSLVPFAQSPLRRTLSFLAQASALGNLSEEMSAALQTWQTKLLAKPNLLGIQILLILLMSLIIAIFLISTYLPLFRMAAIFG